MTPRPKPFAQETLAIGIALLLGITALVVIGIAGLARSWSCP